MALIATAGLLAIAACGRTDAAQQALVQARPQASGWLVQPSFKYDVLCLLNVLTGDPYYLNFYEEDYNRFEPELTPEIRAALANVHRVIKTEGGGIVSARLTLYFSVVDDSTLAGMSDRLDDLPSLQRRLEATPYYAEESWQSFESIAPDLQVIFDFLTNLDYEKEWTERHLPELKARAAELESQLPE